MKKTITFGRVLLAATLLIGTAAHAGGPLYQLNSGGTFNPATDKVVTIRNGGGTNNPEVQTALAPSAAVDTTNAANITSGTLPAARLPNPAPSALGGVQSAAAVANQFVTSISTSGVVSLAQPAITGVSGIGTPTGTGNLVFSASPTFTGTVNAAGLTTTGATQLSALAGVGTRNVCVTSAGVLSDSGCSSGGVSLTTGSANLIFSPGTITGTGTINTTSPVNAQTGSTYTIAASDMGGLVTQTNASSIATTLPDTTASGFGPGAAFTAVNLGAGVNTITPQNSKTINGAANIKLYKNGFYYINSSANQYVAAGFAGYGTVTSGAMVKFTADTSGGLTAATAGTDYQAPITLTTTGSSGAATLIGNTLNIPQYAGGGGGGTPGGSNGQFQFNNSGSFAGSSRLTDDGTTISVAAPTAFTASVATGTSSILMSGTVATGGSSTTNLPSILVQPSGTTAATDWSTLGTPLGMNVASGFNGRFIDLHVNGGTSVFNIGGGGNTTIAGNANYIFNSRSKSGSPADGIILITNNAGTGFIGLKMGTTTNASPYLKVDGAGVSFRNGDDTNASGVRAGGYAVSGTTFTASGSGCTVGSLVGGATAGQMTASAGGACTITVTMGAGAPTPTNRWLCNAWNETSPTNALRSTGGTSTTCTFAGTVTNGDVIAVNAVAF